MRLISAALAVLLLCFAPVVAQPSTPVPATPDIPIGEIERGAQLVTDAMDRYGTTSVFIVLILVIILALIYFIFRPLSGTVTSSNKDAAESRREVAQTNRELLTYLKNSGTVTEGNTEALKAVAVSHEKSEKAYGDLKTEVHDSSVNIMQTMNDHRKEGMKEVNDHTDETALVLNQKLDLIISRLQLLKIDVPDQKERIETTIQIARETKLNDTGQLPPLSSITDRDPGKPFSNGDEPRADPAAEQKRSEE